MPDRIIARTRITTEAGLRSLPRRYEPLSAMRKENIAPINLNPEEMESARNITNSKTTARSVYILQTILPARD